MNSKACFDALAFEIAHLRSMGQEPPWEARDLVALDIEDALEADDPERLETIWREIPAMLREAMAFHAERGGILL